MENVSGIQEKPKSLKKKIIPITIIVIALTVILLSRFLQNDNGDIAVNEDNRITVKVETVRETEFNYIMSYKANLEPVEEAMVTSQTSGLVTSINFEEGQTVEQGTVLATLDSAMLTNDLEAAQIALITRQSNLDTAQRNYDRNQTLYENGALSAADFENFATALSAAEADFESQEITISGLEISLTYCSLKAPISGNVEEKAVVLGQYVNPGTVIAKIKNISSLKAIIQLKESDLDKVRVGQQANFKASSGDQEFTGVVRNIAATADNTSRVFNCEVIINNSNGKLRAGTFGYIELDSGQQQRSMIVSLAALSGSEGNYYVFVYDDGVARKHSVNIGDIQGDVVQITSGLEIDENVIVTNINALQEGDKVRLEGQEA